MKRVIAVALFSAGLISAPALAQSQASGWYVGGSIGQMEAKDACDGVGIGCDDKDTAWKIFAGYQINQNFAVEGGYTDLGKVSASGTVGGVSVNAKAEATAWELVGVGSIPVGNSFSLYGKGGFYRGEVDADASAAIPGFSASAQESDTNTDLTFGIGAAFAVNRNVSLRAEWQRYKDVGGSDTGESDIDVMSVGLLFRF